MTVPQVVVLAGGLGTRLGPLETRGPKVLQPVAGEPFIELLFRGFARLGLTSVHLCLGHRASEVLDHLEQSPHPELWVTHSIDTVANRGTAAAIRAARPYLSERFLIWLGDTYVTPDFTLPNEVGAPVMVLTDKCGDVVPNATLADDGTVSYHKAGGPGFSLVDAGIAVLDRSFFDDPYVVSLASLEDCWKVLSAHSRLAGYCIRAEVFDIGTPERINALERHLKGYAA